jgi:predicted 3-demethylubiquinone-9 3-methyltransferase (glyoxalase superfamily)
MTTITPFLWFDDGLEQAIERYRSVFGDVEVHSEQRMPMGDAPNAGSIFVAEFSVLGQRVMGMNAGPSVRHTEAFSFYVSCEDQAEVDRYWDGLIADGGEESQCGWLKDPWGVSWQIIPTALERLQSDPDREAAGRAMQAMLGMQKIIVAELEAAFRGE